MYAFNTTRFGPFSISVSTARQGARHVKRFAEAGVTPETQETVNVYMQGGFTLSWAGFEQQLSAGSCSLDLQAASFPEGIDVVETVTSAWARRACVSCSASWSREVLQAATGATISHGRHFLVFVASGAVSSSCAGSRAGGFVMATPGCVVSVDEPSRLIVLKELA